MRNKNHSQIKKYVALLVLALMQGLYASSIQALEYDLVILNGRLMDPESGLDAIRNVGVKDGKIAKITKGKLKGTESIDASGFVVAPGFVDGHFHNVLVQFGRKLALRDGAIQERAYSSAIWYTPEAMKMAKK